jgi:hypothetical protein
MLPFAHVLLGKHLSQPMSLALSGRLVHGLRIVKNNEFLATTVTAQNAHLHELGHPLFRLSHFDCYGSHKKTSVHRPVILFRVWLTFVLLKIVLRDPIESERCHRALKSRGRHAPGTTGTAPAVEIIAVDPNEALFHGHLPFL